MSHISLIDVQLVDNPRNVPVKMIYSIRKKMQHSDDFKDV